MTETISTEDAKQPERLGYRISEWSRMTGTSRITTWRAIKAGKLRSVSYCGITLIHASERARFFSQS